MKYAELVNMIREVLTEMPAKKKVKIKRGEIFKDYSNEKDANFVGNFITYHVIGDFDTLEYLSDAVQKGNGWVCSMTIDENWDGDYDLDYYVHFDEWPQDALPNIKDMKKQINTALKLR